MRCVKDGSIFGLIGEWGWPFFFDSPINTEKCQWQNQHANGFVNWIEAINFVFVHDQPYD